ncbi:MAG: hypothetical protein J6R41_06990 [Paludibacteraceae bacterium]|nr:hypothetical protein [Paludibacteraceae bacterium]
MKAKLSFSVLAVLCAFGSAMFSSCSDDDDDKEKPEPPVVKIDTIAPSFSAIVNGSDLDTASVIKFNKATLSKSSDSLVSVKLVLTKGNVASFESVSISKSNKFEKTNVCDTNNMIWKDVAVTGTDSVSEMSLTFVGVNAEYTISLTDTEGETTTAKFTLEGADKKDYNSSSRYMSSTQKTSLKSGDAANFLGWAYIPESIKENAHFEISGELAKLSEEVYIEYLTGLKSDWVSADDFFKPNEDDAYFKTNTEGKLAEPLFYVYKSNEEFYLIKVLSADSESAVIEYNY